MTNNSIAIFSAFIAPHLGGVERYTDNLAKQLVSLGYRPILVTANYQNEKEIETINEMVIIRLPVYSLFKKRYPILKLNRNYHQLISILNSYNIISIIVNTRFYLTSHVGANYGKKHNIPVYLIEHGSNYVTLDNKFIDFFANKYEDFLTGLIKGKITGFYGVSNTASEWLNHFGIKASGIWYNSIDISQYTPKKEKHESVVFMYAGRLIKQKGILNLLNAFVKLHKKYGNIHLYIAGNGAEINNYKEEFNNKSIEFLGNLNYQALLMYYAKTDIFVYPPLWPEGLPTSILEAGLMKCAVIGTDQGGIKEVLNDNNGIIVKTNEIDLFNAMEKLLIDSELRNLLANNIYSNVVQNFSWSTTANKILKDMDINNDNQ